MKVKNDMSVLCNLIKKKDYIHFLKNVLSYSDEVYMLTNAYSREEFENSMWTSLKYNFSDFFYGTCDRRYDQGAFVSFPCNYAIREFLLNKENMYDFDISENGADISLEDPAFVKNGEIFCYTITHENFCIISKEVYEKIF